MHHQEFFTIHNGDITSCVKFHNQIQVEKVRKWEKHEHMHINEQAVLDGQGRHVALTNYLYP